MAKSGKTHIIKEDIVVRKIHYLRNQKVMLDRDLAVLYGVRATRLREQVKRNLERFPGHFMFRLNEEEVKLMVSQNAIPSIKHLGGYSPYVFTEHGILMLANILKSKKAVAVSLRLIEIFVKMREMLSTHKDILLKLEQLERKVKNHDQEIQTIFAALKQLLYPEPKPRTRIGFRLKGKK